MTHEQLTPNELIWLFIDGAASPDESDMLFSSLAGNPDLQHDFHNAITLRSALEHSRERSVVPPILTNRVMGAAGITVGGAAIATSFWSSLRDTLSITLQKSAIPLASAAVASVLTWFFMNNAEHSGAEYSTTMQSTTASSAQTQNTASSSLSPSVSTLNQPQYATESSLQPHTRIRYIYVERPRHSATGMPDSIAAKPALMPIQDELLQPEGVHPDISTVDYRPPEETITERAAQLIEPLTHTITSGDSSIAPPRRLSQYTVSVRGISGLTMYPYRDLVSNATMFNNITGTLLYSLNKRHALGVEFGTEAFPMYALSLSENGTWNYNEKPNMMFGGALYQYTGSPLEEFNALSPVVRGFVGGTNWGPLVKGTIGVQYNPNDMITLGIGMEGTSLWYSQEEHWFSTQKLSFTYWIGLRL